MMMMMLSICIGEGHLWATIVKWFTGDGAIGKSSGQNYRVKPVQFA